jgi:hypothetical protein
MHLLTAFVRLHKHSVHGFHAFRRFRITWLRDLGTPEDILRCWVGHQGFGITDRYSKLAENVELRKQCSVRAGVGFDISIMGHAPRITKKPSKPKSVADVVAPPSEPSYVGVDADLPEFLFEEPVAKEA